jgi:outer membrane murein-binding lipoprotein Lpp
MRKIIFVTGAVVLLSGCTSLGQYLTSASSLVQTACNGVEAVKADAQANVKGGAANTVSGIAAYVDAGCSAADKVAAIASDPNTLQWLGQMQGQLQTLIDVAKGKTAAPPVVVPAPVVKG